MSDFVIMGFAFSKAALLMHWLLIDVSGLAERPGAIQDVSTTGNITGLRGGLGWVSERDPVKVDLTLESLREGVLVTGTAEGLLRLNCSRCLVEYEQEFERKLDEVFYFNPEEAEQKEGYEMSGTVVDLEPMLRDAILLDIPAQPLHDADCRGLCPICGIDLNLGNCEHRHGDYDPRWAPLRELMQKLNDSQMLGEA
jgi:uncharacterized protein